MLTLEDMPDVKLTANGKFRQAQPMTIRNVRKVLEHLDIVARFDMCTAGVAFFMAGERIPPEKHGYAVETISDILVKLDINNLSRLDSIITEIARDDQFHPMEDWLNALEWDGVDRLPDLAATITTDNPLWPVYLRKWLVQTVEGACGWREAQERTLPHVLVLVGGQGLGKSHWLSRLGGEWFKGEAELHLSAANSKDHQIEVLRYPMAELSELDGIFRKNDISLMKSFISRGIDSIRAPYERRPVIRPRMTSFCASVNDAEFLNDPTGSRRFWPVLVEGIDWGFEMDWGQVWAQAFELWLAGESFNLVAEDDAVRAQIASETHFMESGESEKVREYLRLHMRNPAYPEVAMSTLDVLEMLYGRGRNFGNKQKADASRALHDILGKHRTISGKQRAWLMPYNEFATDAATWPDKITLISAASDLKK